MNKVNLSISLFVLLTIVGFSLAYSQVGAVGVVNIPEVPSVPSQGTPSLPPAVGVPSVPSIPTLPGHHLPSYNDTSNQTHVSVQVVEKSEPYWTVTVHNPYGSYPYKIEKIEVTLKTNPNYGSSTNVYFRVQAGNYNDYRIYKLLKPNMTYSFTFKPGDDFGGQPFPSWIRMFEVSSYPYPDFIDHIVIKVYYYPQPPEVTVHVYNSSGYDPLRTRVVCTGHEVDARITDMRLYVDNKFAGETPKLSLSKLIKISSPGNHTIKCVATSENMMSARNSSSVYVIPAPDFFVPSYLVKAPRTITSGQDLQVNFTVENLGDANESLADSMPLVQVYVDGNITWSGKVHIPAGQSQALSLDLGNFSVGNHSLSIYVDPYKKTHDKDYSNNNYTTNFTVISGDHPPVANFYWSPVVPSVNQTVMFYSNSSDPDNNIVSYSWNFGDGFTAQGATTMHIYRSSGDFKVSLNVTDSDGLSSTVTKMIHVVVKPFINQFVATPTSGHYPLVVTFNFSAVSPGSKNLTYILNYGDGNIVSGHIASDKLYSLVHTYTNTGLYNATLMVTNNDGYLDSKTIQLNVTQDHPPIILYFNASNTTGFVPLNVTFSFSATDPDNDTLFYVVDFGDNSSISGTGNNATFNHTYTTPGQFVVTLTVSDAFGNYGMNTSSEVVVYAKEPLPDLVISSVSLPQVFQETKNATITVNISNIGITNATNVSLGFAYSLLNRVSAAPFAEVGTVNVSAGETKSVRFVWQPPIYGNYSLLFAVDPNNTIPELNESNNEYTSTVSVQPLPDLAIISDSLSASRLLEGHSGNISVMVLNIGHASANTSVYLKYNGTVIGNETVFVPRGDFAVARFAVLVPVGVKNMTVTAIADPDNTIPELNESNNMASKTFSIIPDSAPIISAISNQNITVGQTLRLKINATDPDNDTITFSDNTTLFAINNTTGLIVFTPTASDIGVYHVKITASDGIKSSSVVFTLTVSPSNTTVTSYDAAVYNLTVPSEVYANTTFDISFYILNDGNQNFSTQFYVYLNDSQINSGNVSLSPGESRHVILNYSVGTIGHYTVRAVVDPDNVLNETNTSNNVATAQLNVTARSVNLPPVANAGPEVWAKVGTPAVFNASASYDPDGNITSYLWNFGDGTNGTGKVVTHIYNSTGLYTVILTVTDNNGSESSDTTLAVIWNDTGLPDFVPYLSNLNIVWGQNSTLNLWIYNLGNVSNNTTVLAYLGDGGSNSSLLVNKTVLVPAINKTLIPIEINYTGNLSHLTFEAVVNPNNTVPESNTSNNKLVVNITVFHKPVAKFTASPTSGYAPLTVRFDASASYDPDGNITSYLWNFGDGTNGTGKVVTHIYRTTGRFVAKLTVTDDDGLKSTVSSVITVSSAPSGGGAGGGGHGWVIIHSPSTPAVVTKTNVVTYTVGRLSISRSYKYTAKQNETVITTTFVGSGNVTDYLIKDTIPKSIAKLLSDIDVNPSPDKVFKADPIIGWRVGLGAGQSFTVTYTIPGKVDISLVKSMNPPVVIVIPPVNVQNSSNKTSPPANNTGGSGTTNVTNSSSMGNKSVSPITGLVTFAQGNVKNFIILVLLAIFIALVAVYFDVVNRVKNVTDAISPDAEGTIQPVEIGSQDTDTEHAENQVNAEEVHSEDTNITINEYIDTDRLKGDNYTDLY